MNITDFNSITALFGGLTGIGAIAYALTMIHFARKKDREIQQILINQARIEGILLGRYYDFGKKYTKK